MPTSRFKKTLGLALGGGGARGLAHIGVLKAFEEEGIPVDFITGTSMGGFLAAVYASGIKAFELEAEALFRTRLTQLMRLIDPTSPRRGLLEGNRVRAYLCELLGNHTDFASLSIPLALTATNLPTGEEVVLTEGSLVEATLATIAVPGVFPKVQVGRYELVDGGLLNNVPADVARNMGAEVVVAVDVTPMLPGQGNNQGAPEDRWPHIFPTLVRDFYKAELIMVSYITRARLEKAKPEVLIQPAIPPEISIFWGFNLAAEAIAAGEEAARAAAPEIRKLIGA